VSDVIKASGPDDTSIMTLQKTVVAILEYETERIVDSLSESIGKWLPTPDMPKPRKAAAKKTKKVSKKVVKKARKR